MEHDNAIQYNIWIFTFIWNKRPTFWTSIKNLTLNFLQEKKI